MAALLITAAEGSIASDSLRERLAQAISDAAGHRYPDTSGCCWPGLMCEGHERDMCMFWALRIHEWRTEKAASAKEALAYVRSLPGPVKDEICGATRDGELIAAIRGGEGGLGK